MLHATVVIDIFFFIRGDTLFTTWWHFHIYFTLTTIFALKDTTILILWNSSYNTSSSHAHLLAKTCHNVYWQKLKPRTASCIKQSAPSCHTLKYV
jgi:hypothetical protein